MSTLILNNVFTVIRRRIPCACKVLFVRSQFETTSVRLNGVYIFTVPAKISFGKYFNLTVFFFYFIPSSRLVHRINVHAATAMAFTPERPTAVLEASTFLHVCSSHVRIASGKCTNMGTHRKTTSRLSSPVAPRLPSQNVQSDRSANAAPNGSRDAGPATGITVPSLVPIKTAPHVRSPFRPTPAGRVVDCENNYKTPSMKTISQRLFRKPFLDGRVSICTRNNRFQNVFPKTVRQFV